MMAERQEYLSDLLRAMVPPQAVIHIGAGAGRGPLHRWRTWPVPHALLIDADVGRLAWSEAELAQHPGWRAVPAVLAAEAASHEYFEVSNPDEDGLISPERMAALWPNLRCKNSSSRATVTLQTVLAQPDCSAIAQAACSWAIVDCLPALAVLQGAGPALANWSVIWARVMLQPAAGNGLGAGIDELDGFLRQHGYRCAHVTEENHPALGLALFVRDWPGAQASLTQELTQLRQQAASQATQAEQIAQLSAARDEYAALSSERQQHIDTLAQERAKLSRIGAERQSRLEELEASHSNQHAQLEALRRERDDHAHLAATHAANHAARSKEITSLNETESRLRRELEELLAHQHVLAQEREQLQQQAAALQVRIDSLTVQVDEQRQACQAAAAEAAALQTRSKELQAEVEAAQRAGQRADQNAAERSLQIDKLQAQLQQAHLRVSRQEAELAEQGQRQSLLNDELLRAEAQISLITDVLLREQGL